MCTSCQAVHRINSVYLSIAQEEKISLCYKQTYTYIMHKDSFISETYNNLDHLNRHWPKIPANLIWNLERFARQKKNSNWLKF